jgi:hypothetical protein
MTSSLLLKNQGTRRCGRVKIVLWVKLRLWRSILRSGVSTIQVFFHMGHGEPQLDLQL